MLNPDDGFHIHSTEQIFIGRSESAGTVGHLGRLVLSNITILIGGLVVLELIFGNWFNPNRMNRLNLPRDVAISFDVSHLYPATNKTVTYKRDGFGLRGSYPSLGAIDILTIGGSATDQRFISEGDTWQDVVVREFLQQGKTVSVVNAGIDGQSTRGHIKDFDWWFPFLPGLHARYILFYIGLNDLFVDDVVELDRLVKNPSLARTFQENSALYSLYNTLKGMYNAYFVTGVWHDSVAFGRLEWTDTPRIHNYAEVMSEHLAAYKERLTVLIGKAYEIGSVPILVTQPSRKYRDLDGKILGVSATYNYRGTRVNGVDLYHMMQLIHETTLHTGEQFGAMTIDLANTITWEEDDFYDFEHNTPKGAEKIGRYLHSQLQELSFERSGLPESHRLRRDLFVGPDTSVGLIAPTKSPNIPRHRKFDEGS